MTTKVYKLKALTNLHAGSGDLSFGVVDKLVQRDPVNRFPVIHGTSMKGSLKEFCENNFSIDEPTAKTMKLIETGQEFDAKKALDKYLGIIFGKGDRPGTNKFFSAHLLTLPVRSNIKPFYRATCPAIIIQFIESLKTFNIHNDSIQSLDNLRNIKFLDSKKKKLDFILFQKSDKAIVIEDWINSGFNETFDWNDHHNKWFGAKDEFVLIKDDIFLEICEDLPVVARNQLGDNRNLWYEELVPRQSEFWFFHLYPKKNNAEEHPVDIIKEIKAKKFPVQIGANATVGYGYCQLETIPATTTKKSNTKSKVKK